MHMMIKKIKITPKISQLQDLIVTIVVIDQLNRYGHGFQDLIHGFKETQKMLNLDQMVMIYIQIECIYLKSIRKYGKN